MRLASRSMLSHSLHMRHYNSQLHVWLWLYVIELNSLNSSFILHYYCRLCLCDLLHINKAVQCTVMAQYTELHQLPGKKQRAAGEWRDLRKHCEELNRNNCSCRSAGIGHEGHCSEIKTKIIEIWCSNLPWKKPCQTSVQLFYSLLFQMMQLS